MREINFRAWYKSGKQMINDIGTLEFFEGGQIYVNEELVGCILMQFTGLYDRNNKPIYEDDIASGYIPDTERDEKFSRAIVKFIEGSWSLCDCLGRYLGELYSCSMNLSTEVIGNIYDNPELLNKEGGT